MERTWFHTELETPARFDAVDLRRAQSTSCHAVVKEASFFEQGNDGGIGHQKTRGAKSRKIKWAASQEAVTFPWLSAHSIRKRIGGDNYMVAPFDALSRDNFGDSK
jgi:hypothetical protein